jgi:hypothetical protein
VIDSINEIAAFVACRRKGNNVKRIMYYYRGSFNICIHIKFKDASSDAIIRFAKISIVVGMDAPSACATIMRKRDVQREP